MVLLFLMMLIWIADRAGFPLAEGNPLPAGIQEWVREHPDTVLSGEAASVRETEESVTVLLNNSFLIFHSSEYPVEKVQITVRDKIPEAIVPGTFLVVSGNMEEFEEARNPGEFDRKQYMACRHCFYQIQDARILQTGRSRRPLRAVLYRLKARFRKVLERAAGEDAAELIAIALGDKTELEREEKMRYQMAGILHIFVVSGLHISVIGLGLYEFLLRRAGLGIPVSGVMSASVLLFYSLMTGGGISTMRAVSMFLILILGRILGRIYDMLTALACAGILLLLESPGYLYDSGFQLSFAAVAGTALLYPALEAVVLQSLFAERKQPPQIKPFLMSLSVQLSTLPVVLSVYGEAPLAGIFLNLLVLPTAGIVLISAVGAMTAGSLFLPAGILAAYPGRLMLKLYRLLSCGAGFLPLRTWITGTPGPLQTALYMILTGAAAGLGEYLTAVSRRGRRPGRRSGRKIFIVAVLLLASAVLTLGAHSFGNVRVTVLDIGQGSCTAVETGPHHGVLLDGGSTNKENIGQYVLLPFLKSRGIREIDAVLVSHTDQDHISGIREILKLQEQHLSTVFIHTLILPAWREEEAPEAFAELIHLAQRAGVRVCLGAEGDIYEDGGVRFRILAPESGKAVEDSNEDGMIVRMEYGDFSMLFPGDIGEETEKMLLEKLEKTEVLLSPHHGSAYSGSREFLEKVQPGLAVISCSADNLYGHPSPDAVERLEKAGAEILYTMKSGAVMIDTDGREYRAEAFLNK